MEQGRVMDDFETEVIDLVYAMAKVGIQGMDCCVPDFYDTLNDAVIEFDRKYKQNPTLFPTPRDAANWTYAVVANMNRRATPELIVQPDWDTYEPFDPNPYPSLDPTPYPTLDPNPYPTSYPNPSPQPQPLPLDPGSLGAAIVIQRYFADPQAPHSGRLSLTIPEVEILAATAQYGLNDQSPSIQPDAYLLISEIMHIPVDKLQDTLYKARAAFAEIFYVVGALGPKDAFASTTTLSQAITDFQSNFRGQNDWSILKYAARFAIPEASFARVDPAPYTKAIQSQYAQRLDKITAWEAGNADLLARKTTPDQAQRLGWEPGSPPPPTLLHAVEARAAEAFGNPHPRCVLFDCEAHREGGTR